jgi:hypothetical protein
VAAADSIAYVLESFTNMKFPKEYDPTMIHQMTGTLREYTQIAVKEIAPNLGIIHDALYATEKAGASLISVAKQFSYFPKNLNVNMQEVRLMVDAISGFSKMSLDNYSQKGNVDKSLGLTDKVVSKMTSIAKRFKDVISNMKRFDNKWMSNVSSSIKTYVELAMWLDDKDVNYTKVKNAVNNMQVLSDGYSRLARGLEKINMQLQKIDVSKLTALKNLTGSIVLMSLMDPNQFNKMMDALEKKSSVFIDIMSEMEKASEKKSKTNIAKMASMKSGGIAGGGKTIGDVYKIMSQIDAKMATLVSYSSQFSSYINEIRNSDLNVKGASSNY